jgi:hypothetical protein
MAKLPFRLRNDLEKLLQMESGFILDLSNAKFAILIGEVANIDIYNGEGYTEYCSKAKKLRQLIEKEDDIIVGKVLNELLLYCGQYLWDNNSLDRNDEAKLNELLDYANQLISNGLNIQLPETKEETLQTLLEDINISLSRNKPTLVLDRLHTFSTKYLRMVCESKGISVLDDRGNYYPLHSLAGMLKKHFEKENETKSEFTLLAIQNSISLFDKYNSIRNNQSFAHDNEILENIEAEFVVKNMANTLVFIEKIESQSNLQKNHLFGNSNDGLPF